MKKIYLILTTLFVTFAGNLLQTQNPFWTFPNQYWNNIEGPGILPPANNTTTANYTHAGILDPYGEIMFFKVDAGMYDKDGDQTHTFMNYNNDYISGSAETLIVPQPGTCDKFYIFHAGQSFSQDDELPYFSSYVHSERPDEGGLQESEDINGNAFNIEGNLIEEVQLKDWEQPVVTIDAPVYRGNSGSPVINQDGEVIGVIFATIDDDETGKVGLFVPIDYFHDIYT